MTLVEGQIESSKKLREVLDGNNVTRFSSIGDINCFLKSYDSEKYNITKNEEYALNLEIHSLKEKLNQTEEKRKRNLLTKCLLFVPSITLKRKCTYLTSNCNLIVSERIAKKKKELEFTRNLVDSLYPLIAGAVGENQVVKEIQKLSDNYYLINDFSLDFNPPIYDKRDKDRIFSIQIDHLLVSRSGLFILETKNWSEESINSFDLRSPVKQIKRTSYALFVLLNSDSKSNRSSLARHHWGIRKIPIRSIIVMINRKPKEEFKHVKVLSLKELNGYIKYFDPIFSETEVENIFRELKNETH